MNLPSAEAAYLFRHSIVRDAAYELQPLSVRGRLHELVVGVIEDMHGGEPPQPDGVWNLSMSKQRIDPWSLELADHAEQARQARPDVPELARKSAEYLKRAAWHEDSRYHSLEALALYLRLTTHPGATPLVRMQAHVGAGQVYYRLGEITKAGAEYAAADKLTDPVNDPQGAMVVRTCIAIIDSHSDNGPGPAMVHKEAATFWRKVGNVHGEVQALVNYAIWHCEFGDEDEGETALLRAVELSRRTRNPRVEAAAVGNLASLWNKQQRFAESETAMRQAIEISRKGQNPVTEVTWMLGLAGMLRGTGRPDESEREFKEAMRVAAAAELQSRVDFAQCQLAAMYIEQGRVGEARGLWAAAWPLVLGRGDEYTTASVRKAMLDVLNEQGMPAGEWFS